MGGDHKCPLCSATFTRPQHVGRHLRAHTGDRPYECKQCPLRFARSDLLSRHVNKAHGPPEENGTKESSKRGRRKSMGSTTEGEALLKSHDRIRSASFAQPSHPFNHEPYTFQPPILSSSASASLTHPPSQQQQQQQQQQQAQPGPRTSAQTALPAHAIYPNHPLLTNTPHTVPHQAQTWSSPITSMPNASALNSVAGPSFTNPFAMPSTNMPMVGTYDPSAYFAGPGSVPMRLTGSEQGSSFSGSRNPMLQPWNGLPAGYDVGYKKRACDQCNHSKVRCDFADPCIRCLNKNIACSYNKPQKSRSTVQPIPYLANQRLSLPNFNPALAAQLVTSISPESSFSSPHSITTSPIASTLNIPTTAVAAGIPFNVDYAIGPNGAYQATNTSGGVAPPSMAEQERRRSFSTLPPQFYPPVRPGMPMDSYTQVFPIDQSWQTQPLPNNTGRMYPNAGANASSAYLPASMPASLSQQLYSSASGQAMPHLAYAQQQQPLQNPQTAWGHQQHPSQQSHSQTQPSAQSFKAPRPQTPQSFSQASPVNTISPSRQPLPSGAPSMVAEKSVSPPVAGAPTPALTSHSTSPSGPDEPAEHRNSFTGSITGWNFSQVAAADTRQKPVEIMPTLSMSQINPGDGTFTGSGVTYSPATTNAMLPPSTDTQTNHSGAVPSVTAPNFYLGMNAQDLTWPIQEATIDPRLQPRSNAQNELDDDGTLSQAGSSHRSSLFDIDDGINAIQNAIRGRRRSSTTSIWSSAFNNMTLHDSAGNPISAADVLSNPYTAAQIASNLQQSQESTPKRPSFPTMGLSPGGGSDANRLPSMSDVKDLWKLFMAEPMTGPTPGGERTGLDFSASQVTPRPNMGHRTLSKSNSMPDLTSPTLLNQAFFANYAQVKPDIAGASQVQGDMTATQSKVALGENGERLRVTAPKTNEDFGNLKKWKNEIQQRQAAFTMTMQPGANKRGSVSGTDAISFIRPSTSYTPNSDGQELRYVDYAASLEANPAMEAYNHNRPVASVLQHNAALNMTLAPERAPSFGMGPPSATGSATPVSQSGTGSYPTPLPSKFNSTSYSAALPQGSRQVPKLNTSSQALVTSSTDLTTDLSSTAADEVSGDNAQKPTSADARPGNKRLASQTLVSADGKKTSFSLFGDEDDALGEGEEELSYPSGNAYSAGPIGVGHMGYAGNGIPVPGMKGWTGMAA